MTFSEKLDNLISAPTSPFARRMRPTYPNGWEPGVLHGEDGAISITTDLLPKLDDESSWESAVESLGVNVPEGYVIRLYEARYDPAAWHRDTEDGEAVTRPAWRYRFKIEQAKANSVPIDEILELVNKHKPKKRATEEYNGDAHWILATGDWQLGKIDGDGVEGTVDRILEATDRSIDRIKELKRLKKWPGKAVLALTGDCVEGFVSQNGGNTWRTNLTMTEQVRLYRRLVFHIITKLSDEVDSLLVVAVPGNHGETVRLAGKMSTRMDDSWDVDAIIAIADSLEQNKAFSHVKFVTPTKDEGAIVLDFSGTVTALAHGHQVPRGDVPKWVAEHAKNMAPVGDAHLIITGHHHHLRVQSLGPRTWIQVPAMESESTWWKERTGEVSPPGMVSVIVGGSTWSDLTVI